MSRTPSRKRNWNQSSQFRRTYSKVIPIGKQLGALALCAWANGRFIEIESNLRRKKLRRTNQGFNFLEAVLVRASIQFRRESKPQHLKR